MVKGGREGGGKGREHSPLIAKVVIMAKFLASLGSRLSSAKVVARDGKKMLPLALKSFVCFYFGPGTPWGTVVSYENPSF